MKILVDVQFSIWFLVTVAIDWESILRTMILEINFFSYFPEREKIHIPEARALAR